MHLGISPQHKGRVIYACALCGTRFLGWACQDRRYCSNRCYHQDQRQDVEHTCAHCGTVFTTRPARRGKYCSRNCFNAAHVHPDKGKRRIPVGVRLATLSDRSGGPEACWPWRGGITSSGYGVITIDKRQTTAHRVAYKEAKGPIPEGYDVAHTCHNRPCVNPKHLEAVPHGENMDQAKHLGHLRGPKTRNPRRGEDSPSAILTAAQVIAIRALRAEGVGYRALGRRFGVSDSTIRALCQRKTWAYLA